MIKQIYGNTLSRVPQCVRSLIPQSLLGRILCVATFAFGAVAFYYASKSYRLNQFKLELDRWVKQEGGKSSLAAKKILHCYEKGNKTLSLAGLQLKTLPACLRLLTSLNRLDISSNSLESLPDSIGGLKALTWLDVSFNLLKSLPESMDGLKALTWLDVSFNLLKSLPESMDGLKALTLLDVSSNLLESLPESVGRLKALTELDVVRINWNHCRIR
ncbi:MAG: leucine-rich repeat domain-containing protein [Chlamydiales bacterium]|nr:leucine-rich repeat domain-containing protein [Chlamydiales bacterium]